jgi:hypothetical protein
VIPEAVGPFGPQLGAERAPAQLRVAIDGRQRTMTFDAGELVCLWHDEKPNPSSSRRHLS